MFKVIKLEIEKFMQKFMLPIFPSLSYADIFAAVLQIII